LHSNNWHCHCLHWEELPMLRVAVQSNAGFKFSSMALAKLQIEWKNQRRCGFSESTTNNINSTFCLLLLAIW